jgi:putative membrane protein
MRALALPIALAMIATACNNDNGGNTNMSTDVNLTEDTAVNDMLGANTLSENEAAVVNPTDAAGFTTALAASDMFEIQSGQLAQTKGSSPEIKSFGQQLVADHTRSSSEMKAAAAKGEPAPTITPALDAEKQAMLDSLKSASGAEFDRLFIEQQATAHQKALTLVQSYAAGGDQPALKEFAGKASAVIQGHLDHVTRLKK